MATSFDSLPDELIHQILHYVPPHETLTAIARVSRRFSRIADTPLLWRFYCEEVFRYWQTSHEYQRRRHAKVTESDWKELFTIRLRQNRRTATLLDDIVASRVLRIHNIEEICEFGYDAKDYLLSQCRVSDEAADDALARRYHASAVLDSIHRSLAIEEWAKYQKHVVPRFSLSARPKDRLECGMKLERALGAFDMFMLHDREGDLDEIAQKLDEIAAQFLHEQGGLDFKQNSTRQKAVALLQWLHAKNMLGMDNEATQYRYLRNCLIGRALLDDRHPSLPIVSAAIFCALGSRIELEAYCCALPGHVHAVVLSQPGMSLNGTRVADGDAQEKMFFDPYGSDEEVSDAHVRDFLHSQGIAMGHDDLMVPTATDLIVMRTAQNIRGSFTSFRTLERPLPELIPFIEVSRGDWARNLQPALYSMIWASIMMVPILPPSEDVRWDWAQDVRDLLNYFYEYFPEDSWLVEKYVCPMYDTFAAPVQRQTVWELPSKRVRERIQEIRLVDKTVKEARRRSALVDSSKVKYRVGQVFKHTRYHYYGLVLGWSVEEEEVTSYPRAGTTHTMWKQPKRQVVFYRCMTGTDGSDHHIVAEENIQVTSFRGGVEVLPRTIRDLLPMAGKFFKRWDGERGEFVSNVREVFPED